jgi:tungstate transport system substrate-binding protein
MSRLWIVGGAGLVAVVAVVAVLLVWPGGQEPRERTALIVQSTTSVRDSGLLDRLIKPGFERRHPEWRLKFIAVGSGQAITNARSGQADALIAHSPPLERKLVADGFSADRPRTVMWNDFVIVGPPGDPAGVRRAARDDAVRALEAIAAAGARGRAHFVSRGDESGTNTKELELWALGRVAKQEDNEPVRRDGDPAWYRKAGLGMAETLRLTQQCPFEGRGCYTLADRGTLQQLISNGAIDALPIVMDGQGPRARGGRTLMRNIYNAYAISPRKFPDVEVEGARDLISYLTSPAFQRALATYPDADRPGFFPAASM